MLQILQVIKHYAGIEFHRRIKSILLLLQRIRGKQYSFENGLAARIFCAALNDPRLWSEAKLMCWVLMPDHVHLLIQIGDNESISQLINRLKTNTARKVNFMLGRTARFWEKGFHDKAIRSEENIIDVARYIVMNPIRADLVKSAGMYPYWSAIWL